MGHRYYLHPHARGLVVFGCCAGLTFACSCWLEHGRSHADELSTVRMTMAVWRRKPKDSVIIHSDQGSQFGSDEFNRWCKDNRLSSSMSRWGNFWDNAVAESPLSSLKIQQIKKRNYQTRAEAKSEIFDYIEGSTIE